MTRARGDRLRGDDGATVVETSIAIFFMLLMFLGFFDLGLAEFKQSQLSSASRDGARVALINGNWAGTRPDVGTYAGGACPASPAGFTKVCTAVLARLAGSSATGITVRCYERMTAVAKNCVLLSPSNPGGMNPGIDSIEVTVTYTYVPVTFVGKALLGGSKAYTTSSRMVIQ